MLAVVSYCEKIIVETIPTDGKERPHDGLGESEPEKGR
jgi:hypothetical protein